MNKRGQKVTLHCHDSVRIQSETSHFASPIQFNDKVCASEQQPTIYARVSPRESSEKSGRRDWGAWGANNGRLGIQS